MQLQVVVFALWWFQQESFFQHNLRTNQLKATVIIIVAFTKLPLNFETVPMLRLMKSAWSTWPHPDHVWFLNNYFYLFVNARLNMCVSAVWSLSLAILRRPVMLQWITCLNTWQCDWLWRSWEEMLRPVLLMWRQLQRNSIPSTYPPLETSSLWVHTLHWWMPIFDMTQQEKQRCKCWNECKENVINDGWMSFSSFSLILLIILTLSPHFWDWKLYIHIFV